MKVIDRLKSVIRLTYYDYKFWIRNAWKFRETLKSHRAWDYEGFLVFIQDFCKDFESNTILGGNKAQKAKVIRLLADRILEDRYFTDKVDFSFGEVSRNKSGLVQRAAIKSKKKHDLPTLRAAWVVADSQKRLDKDYMFLLLNKHLLSFWE